MASTADLCSIITTLGGNPETLADKREKTLNNEIIRLLSAAPTSAEVSSAINNMTDAQVATVKTKLEIQ